MPISCVKCVHVSCCTLQTLQVPPIELSFKFSFSRKFHSFAYDFNFFFFFGGVVVRSISYFISIQSYKCFTFISM